MNNSKIVILLESIYSARKIKRLLIEEDYAEKYIYIARSNDDLKILLKKGIDFFIIQDKIHEKEADYIICEYRDYLFETEILVLYGIDYSDNPEKLEKFKKLGITRMTEIISQPDDLKKYLRGIEAKKEWTSLPILSTEEADVEDFVATTQSQDIIDSDEMDDLDGMNYQDSMIYKKSEKKKQRKKSLLDEYEDKEIELIIPKAKQEKLERITPEQLEEDDSLGVDDFFITIGNKDEEKEKKKEKISLFDKITKNFEKLK